VSKPVKTPRLLLCCCAIALGLILLAVMPISARSGAPTSSLGTSVPAVAEVPEPLPRGCVGVVPPGTPDPCCIYGYIYYKDEPLAGVRVQIEGPDGSTVITTNHRAASSHPYYVADLSTSVASSGNVITITASYDGMASARTWIVQSEGQHVDLGLIDGYQMIGDPFTPDRLMPSPVTQSLSSQGVPEMLGISPVSNTHTAPLAASVSITYSEPISASSVGTRTFAVHAMQTGLLTQAYSVNGSTISLTPPHPFWPGEFVQVSATTGTLSLSGQGPISSTVWQFRTMVLGGTGVFTDSGQNLGAASTIDVALGDLDGDGDLDVFVANEHEPDEIWVNDGTGIFTDTGQSVGTAASRSKAAALGDLDGDGDLDVFIAKWVGGNEVWTNDGTGVFTDSGQSLGGSTSLDVALGDLDGDGDLDAFVANSEGGTGGLNKVWHNDGAGVFVEVQALGGNIDSHGVELGDLDGDGDLDAFIANLDDDNTPYPNQVWWNNGDGTFTNSGQTLGNNWSVDVALGDIDGDGDLDALEVNYTQASFVWINDGSGYYTRSSQIVDQTRSWAGRFGDVDGDGDLDAFIVSTGYDHTGGFPNKVWLNDGMGVFSDSGQTLGTQDSYGVVLGDLNGNGALDAFVGNYGKLPPKPNKVWLNYNPPQPPADVAISGPSSGIVSSTYAFTAMVNPITTTLPLTYVWQADGQTQTPITHTGGLNDSITFTWSTTGTYTISVTASNAAGSVIDTHAITITVSPGGPCYAQVSSIPGITYPTIQAALDVAQDGDTVKVAGYCAGVETWGGLVQTAYISKSLTIRGGYTTTNWTTSDPVANPTTLDAQNAGRVVYITSSNVTLENLRITGGNANDDRGGGIYSSYATLTLSNTVVISNSTDSDGGGICVDYGSAMIIGGQIVGNTAGDEGGGMHVRHGSATLVGVLISGNTAVNGGGIHISPYATAFTQTGVNTVTLNTAQVKGGGIYMGAANVTLDEVYIFDNDAEMGGGLFISAEGIVLNGGRIFENTAVKGGGVYVASGNVTLTGTHVTSNTSSDSGGGMYIEQGSVLLHDGQISNNTSALTGGGISVCEALAAFTMTGNSVISYNETGNNGGGMYMEDDGSVTIYGGQIVGNVAQDGGGIFVASGSVTLQGTHVLSNTADIEGGGICIRQGNLTVNGGRIASNSSEKFGGGVYASADVVTITRCLITDNIAQRFGGGLYLETANAVLENSVIADNRAAIAGSGIYVAESIVELHHPTLARNYGGDGSGLHAVYTSTVWLTNTILVSHTVGITASTGCTATLDGVLWYHNTMANTGGGGTIVVTNAFTGDPTFASDGYHLTAGSVAIDRMSTGLDVDIDGESRPSGSQYDLGADEYIACQSPPDAVFSASPLSGTVPLDVQFEDQSTGCLVTWDWEFGDGSVSGARHPYHTYEMTGTYSVTLTVTGPGGSDTETIVDYVTVLPPTTWTFILYFAGDNDLHSQLERAIDKMERVADRSNVNILVLWDGNQSVDTRLYHVQYDIASGIASPVIPVGWNPGELNTGVTQTLVSFVNWARSNYPADHYFLSIADHGRGTTGIAWDNTSGGDYLSAYSELGSALDAITGGGSDRIDVLFLDACLMAMIEDAYEVKDDVDYFVASENLGWSVFAYHAYISGVDDDTSPEELAIDVADTYFAALHGYPRTISVLDMSAIEDVGNAADTLAQELDTYLASSNIAEMIAIRSSVQTFDSRNYLVLDSTDEYIDLYHFAELVKANISDTGVQNAAQDVTDAIMSCVIAEHHQSGKDPWTDNYWDLDNAHGIAVYFPPASGGWDYNDYVISGTWAFCDATAWDEFLAAYFSISHVPPELPTNPGVPPMQAAERVFLPLVVRE
jgi:PKD repeat protein